MDTWVISVDRVFGSVSAHRAGGEPPRRHRDVGTWRVFEDHDGTVVAVRLDGALHHRVELAELTDVVRPGLVAELRRFCDEVVDDTITHLRAVHVGLN